VDRAQALDLAHRARRLYVKVGQETLRFDADTRPLDDARAAEYLVHADGLMRVPVLIRGDLLVRGYTEELYHEALDGAATQEERR
jgi:hypothetical protein